MYVYMYIIYIYVYVYIYMWLYNIDIEILRNQSFITIIIKYLKHSISFMQKICKKVATHLNG